MSLKIALLDQFGNVWLEIRGLREICASSFHSGYVILASFLLCVLRNTKDMGDPWLFQLV